MYNLEVLNSRVGRKINLHEYKDSLIIYSLTNIITKKIYIGLTKNIKLRVASHISTSLRNPKLYIHKSLSKYGLSNFYLNIEKVCFSYSELLESEKHFISKYQSSNSQLGYNLTHGGNLMIPNKETLLKMRTSQKTIKIAKYSLEGNLIKIYSSIKELARELSTSDGNITYASRTNGKFKNFMFLREDQLQNSIFPKHINSYVVRTGLHRKNVKSAISIKCKLINKQTLDVFTANSLNDLSKFSGLSLYNIKKIKNNSNSENSFYKFIVCE